MPLMTTVPVDPVLGWLEAALAALDQDGDAIAAAYVSMAIALVEKQPRTVSTA